MSTHGSLSHEMTLLDFKWKRHLDEYNGKLHPDWHLNIVVAWWEIDIERWTSYKGWARLKHWDWKFKYPFQFLGYRVGVGRSWETFERRLNGDLTERMLG